MQQKKKPNFEEAVSGRLLISLTVNRRSTANWPLTARRLAVAVSEIY
jgi:hypothetical protein